jgi:flagellar hook-length control protein FliK
VNLNLLNLFAPPSQSQTASAGAPSGVSFGAPKVLGGNIGDLMFGQLLAAQLQSAKGSMALSSAATNFTASNQATQQLQTVIAQLLKKGATLEQIANQLAGSLGSDFLAQLQLQTRQNTSQSLRNALTQMLERALGPPANGPPANGPPANGPPANGPPDGTPSQIAGVLVQRLVQVAQTLAKAGANATGQQHESLGTISDANAGDTPAPNTTAGILNAALVALQQFGNALPSSILASSATATTQTGLTQAVPPPAPWVPTTVSSPSDVAKDGSTKTSALQLQANPNGAPAATPQSIVQKTGAPTVATDPSLALVGSSADTVIGRILARAANVAASQNQSTGGTDAQNASAILQPHLAVTPASSTTNGTTGDALVASALRSLQAALAALPPPKTDNSASADSSSSLTAVAPAGATALTNVAFSAAAAAIAPATNTTVANNAPAQSLQQQPQTQTPPTVDPNAVVDQVLQGISMRNLSDGSQAVRMRLVPETLGSVTVNLQIQNGSVNATLLAQNTDVRDALLANQQMLTRSLADAGLRLASFTVNLANSGQYQQNQNPYQPRFGTTRRFVGITSSADDEIAAVPSYSPPSSQLAALQWLNALA